MRYTYLRDWRGGLLLRCRSDRLDQPWRLSRIACGPMFDCAASLARRRCGRVNGLGRRNGRFTRVRLGCGATPVQEHHASASNRPPHLHRHPDGRCAPRPRGDQPGRRTVPVSRRPHLLDLGRDRLPVAHHDGAVVGLDGRGHAHPRRDDHPPRHPRHRLHRVVPSPLPRSHPPDGAPAPEQDRGPCVHPGDRGSRAESEPSTMGTEGAHRRRHRRGRAPRGLCADAGPQRRPAHGPGHRHLDHIHRQVGREHRLDLHHPGVGGHPPAAAIPPSPAAARGVRPALLSDPRGRSRRVVAPALGTHRRTGAGYRARLVR